MESPIGADDTQIPQSHKDELDRRLKTLQDDQGAGSSWPDVKERVLKALERPE
jgi:putative addiction module component (TIGR02574 family)